MTREQLDSIERAAKCVLHNADNGLREDAYGWSFQDAVQFIDLNAAAGELILALNFYATQVNYVDRGCGDQIAKDGGARARQAISEFDNAG
jgi:hypothetical protein